jgi:hypothetical protein
MDHGDSITLLVFFGIVIGLPALAWFGYSIFQRWLRHVEALHNVSADFSPQRAAQYEAKIERLEQRLGVIERILTDRSAHLSEEIERLRDAPVN